MKFTSRKDLLTDQHIHQILLTFQEKNKIKKLLHGR